MKKIFAMLLAVMMVFSLATVAFANETPVAPETSDGVTASSSTTTIVLNKLYTITGAKDNTYTTETDEVKGVYPHETLKFESTPDTGNPTNQNLTIDDLTVAYNEASYNVSGTMAITLPAYTNVGVYKYTVTETAPTNKAQAAVYATESIELQVLVEYNSNHTALEATLYLTDKQAGTNTQVGGTQTTGKVDTFVNTYDVGHLDVKKTISGNLASNKQEFTMTVTFASENPVMSDITVYDPSTAKTSTISGNGWKSYTETITVKADETVSFYNIPAGVTYTVVEDSKHEAADANGTNPETGYTVTGEVETATAITSDKTDSVTVNNDKKTSVETGIALDSMPYVLILAVAAVGLVLFTTKKRVQE